MDGPPLLLLPDYNLLSLSSQTPLATLGSCLLPAVLGHLIVGKMPSERENDSQQTMIIPSIFTQITATYLSKDTKQEKRLNA